MISKIIDKYPYVSFDVFDTLLERKCLIPENIFYKTGENILGQGEMFQKLRQEAQKKAYAKFGQKTTLNCIYSQISEFNNEVLEELKKEEIKQEIYNCYPKAKIFKNYQYALNENKHILIISDMYLSSTVISKMLNKAGYSDFDKLYVSNEYGDGKKSGKLFQDALKEQNISPCNLIHIGDSIRADILGSRKVGVKSIFVPKKKLLVRKIKYGL